MSTTETLLTAEEYARLPDDGRPTELVRGKIVEMNPPTPKHGIICIEIGAILRNYVKEHDLGRVAGNDSCVITEHDPDTVRGADVAFYSYAKVPKGPVPAGYLKVAPDIVIEVLSPSDRWNEMHAKIAEYLDAGVSVVCVLDPATEEAHLFYRDKSPRALAGNDELTFPDQLGDFRVAVRKLFEA
jgi:Uma2 family endonuclease